MTTNNFNAQEWVNQNLTDKEIQKIKLSPLIKEEISWRKDTVALGGKLTGDLIIQDYPQLTEIGLKNHELTSLTVINCPQLQHINIRNNQLTKLELERVNTNGENEIETLIAGENELTNLNLSVCPKIKKLIVPDNLTLLKLEGLNLSSIKNLNLTNTQVSLAEDYKKLEQTAESLREVLREVNETGHQKKLVLVEPIKTIKQAEEAIKRLLEATEKSWREYFESNDPNIHLKKSWLGLSFQHPEKRRKAKEILTWIIETQTNKDYRGLAKKWNGGEEYNPNHDFDGNLYKLLELLGERERIERNKN